MRREGFTLIELLAVIVIITIIAFIATPIILGVIENARKGAAKTSAYGYIDAVEKQVAINELDQNKQKILDGTYKVEELKNTYKVVVKGELPTDNSFLKIEKRKVSQATLCINGYNIEYEEPKLEINGKCTKDTYRKTGNLVLSSTSGQYIYPNIGTFEIIENTSKGKLTCKSDDEQIAICSIENNIVTVTPKGEGKTILTITSEATSDYNSISKAYSVTVEQSPFSTNVKIGDYIKMTPTSTSFTTNKSKTGYTSVQTINPSELNVWRVIKVNSDETIEMISENVSSVYIFFGDQIGYKNLVGYLNEIASQYTNTKYVKSTRHMGYNGQTKYLTNTINSTSALWKCSTGGGCNPTESQGGGDLLYETDTNLVKTALGTLKANKVGTSSASNYWLASRKFHYGSSSYWGYIGRSIDSNGNLFENFLLYYFDSLYPNNLNYAIRPIITLKSGLQATGMGTSKDPYVLS